MARTREGERGGKGKREAGADRELHGIDVTAEFEEEEVEE